MYDTLDRHISQCSTGGKSKAAKNIQIFSVAHKMEMETQYVLGEIKRPCNNTVITDKGYGYVYGSSRSRLGLLNNSEPTGTLTTKQDLIICAVISR